LVRDDSQAGDDPETVVIGSDESLVEAIVGVGANTVVHIAASGGVVSTVDQYSAIVRSNVTLGSLLMEAAAQSPDCAFVGIGSFSQRSVLNGDVAPSSFYAASKSALESFAEYFCSERGLSATFLLPSDIYGPKDPRTRLLKLLAQAVNSDQPIGVTSGAQTISFVHVEDVCEAIAHVASFCRDVGLNRYGLTGPEIGSLRETVERLARDLEIVIPVDWGIRNYRAGEVMVPDFLPAPPGWKSKRKINEGFLELLGEVV